VSLNCFDKEKESLLVILLFALRMVNACDLLSLPEEEVFRAFSPSLGELELSVPFFEL